MRLRRRTSGLLAIIAVALMLLLVAPIIPYKLNLPQIPLTFKPGVQSCSKLLANNTLTTTSLQQYQACQDSYLYPANNLTGHASISYKLWGIGASPFNDSYRETAGNSSALFYLSGTKITSAQVFPFPSFRLNPIGVITIDNTSVTRDPLGQVNVSATITNAGSQPIGPVLVDFSGLPVLSINNTMNGVNWEFDLGGGRYALMLQPGESCSTSQIVPGELPAGQAFTYRVIVETTTSVGHLGVDSIVYQKSFQSIWPSIGITPGWVAAFIQEVNANRTGQKLVEEQTLDSFAQTRFNTQVANYNVSNYGFQQDYNRAFVGSTVQIGETTFWPGNDLPFEYASFLQQSAPGHWSVLTNPAFVHFGYYIGYGPSIVVSQPCQITEFPGGQNIPALLASHGCQFHYEQAVWLVIEVGS